MKKKFPVEHILIEDKKQVWFKGSSTLAMGAKAIQREYFPGYKICLCSAEHFQKLKQEYQ
jgi:hypothetical protein